MIASSNKQRKVLNMVYLFYCVIAFNAELVRLASIKNSAKIRNVEGKWIGFNVVLRVLELLIIDLKKT